jgi:hypothetical protein
VNVNDATTDDRFAALLRFAPGLGPRKAQSLIARIMSEHRVVTDPPPLTRRGWSRRGRSWRRR